MPSLAGCRRRRSIAFITGAEGVGLHLYKLEPTGRKMVFLIIFFRFFAVHSAFVIDFAVIEFENNKKFGDFCEIMLTFEKNTVYC